MGRPPRIDVGGYAYHVLNRGNGRMTIFEDADDYVAFERVLDEAVQRYPEVGVLAYCLMPNHWHMVLYPQANQQLSRFVGWVTLTHTQRWHAHRHNVGGGHVYQGRFKSFLIQTERYLATACRYVERNPVRAGLSTRAEQWRWGSLYRWSQGDASAKALLAPWPTPGGRRPRNWVDRVNTPLTERELEALRRCSDRGRPYGGQQWQEQVIQQFGLESTMRPRGRPRSGPDKVM